MLDYKDVLMVGRNHTRRVKAFRKNAKAWESLDGSRYFYHEAYMPDEEAEKKLVQIEEQIAGLEQEFHERGMELIRKRSEIVKSLKRMTGQEE